MLKSSSAVRAMIRNKSVPICNSSVAEIARFDGVPEFDALLRRTPCT